MEESRGQWIEKGLQRLLAYRERMRHLPDEEANHKFILEYKGMLLQILRTQEQLSRQQLSDYTGVSVSTIKRAENGKARRETYDVLFRFFIGHNEAQLHPKYVLDYLVLAISEVFPTNVQLYKDPRLAGQFLEDIMKVMSCTRSNSSIH